MSLACEITFGSIKLGMLRVTSDLLSKIREGQKSDPFLSTQLEFITAMREINFKVGLDEVLRFQDRVCVSTVSPLDMEINNFS